MKNEKTMLALVLVAALAMVSVAGVALASESSDAYSVNGNITTLDEGDDMTFDIKLISNDSSTVSQLIVKGTYTGTISFYTVDPETSTTATPFAVVVCDKVSGVTFTACDGAAYFTGNATTGTVTLEKGSVQFGTATADDDDDGDDEYFTVDEYFTGKVVAGSASFDMTAIAGAVVEISAKKVTYLYGSDDTNGVIVGNISGIADEFTVNSSENALSMIGDADINIPAIKASGKFTINNIVNGITCFASMIFEITADSTATVFYDDVGSSELENDGGIFIVNGKVIVDASGGVSDNDPDAIDNNGILIVNGIIEYTANVDQTVIDEVSDLKLWSAYYSVKDNAKNVIVHYYTNLTAAMAASDEVTLYGLKLITEDLTVENSLTLGKDAIVVVGIPNIGIDISALTQELIPSNYLDIINNVLGMIGFSFSDLSESNPTVSVAADAVLETADAYFFVINGKLSVDEDGELDESGVKATVCGMTEGTNTIYTNLDTALSLAKSGDTIELSMLGYIFSDATIAKGVTVTATENIGLYSNLIAVYCGATLTIEGTLSVYDLYILPGVDANVSYTINDVEYSASISLDAATVNINKGASLTTTYILLGGVLNIANDFDNTTSGSDNFEVSEIDVFSFIRTSEDIGEIQTSGITFDVNIDSAVMNINGKLNTDATIKANCDSYYGEVDDIEYYASLTINVVGTLISSDIEYGSTDNNSGNHLLTIINVTGKYTPDGDDVVNINVTGNGEVNGTVNVKGTLTSGVVSNNFNENANNTIVKITGDVTLAVVYGTPADKAISIADADDAVEDNAVEDNAVADNTVYYLVDTDNNEVVYVTLYTTKDTKLLYYKPTITGYNFVSWMDDAGEVVSKTAITDEKIGDDYKELYGNFVVKTSTLTLTYTQNGIWIIDGKSCGSSATLDLSVGSHTIKFVADNGYELEDYVIYINGVAITSENFTVSDDKITVTYGGEVKEKTTNGGMDLVTILLIIITIVIVIMAIIIALKLMRS